MGLFFPEPMAMVERQPTIGTAPAYPMVETFSYDTPLPVHLGASQGSLFPGEDMRGHWN